MKEGEAWIIGLKITPNKEVTFQVDQNRTRKLLLTKHELSKIFKATQEKGLTCVPTKLFWKTNLVKIKISLGKGKTKYDKRETLKRKEWDKEKAKISKLSSKFQ
jgi:SsrA-binding protein